jgi:hypothetical protein
MHAAAWSPIFSVDFRDEYARFFHDLLGFPHDSVRNG